MTKEERIEKGNALWTAAFGMIVSGNTEQGMSVYVQILDLLEEMSEEEFKEPEAQALMAKTLTEMAIVETQRGRKDEAYMLLRNGARIWMDMSDEYWERYAYRSGWTYLVFAMESDERNEKENAILLLNMAESCFRVATEGEDRQELLALTLSGRGNINLRLKHVEDACNDYRAALQTYVLLEEKTPGEYTDEMNSIISTLKQLGGLE